MRGVFEDGVNEVFERPQRKSDPELTLGWGALLLLFCGLVLVCGLCFGLGYAVGHRSPQQTSAEARQPAPGTPQSRLAMSSAAKPSATSQPAAAQPAPNAPAGNPQPSQPQPASAMSALPPQAPAPPAPLPSQPQVRPALPLEANPPLSASGAHATPAVPPPVPFMVQIAAVSHQEDASVLVTALRNRGYAVSAGRGPGDNLIHVRIGPFDNRDEANRWRLKLLDDGYNAIIQP